MNALLIHNDNLPTRLIEEFKTSVKFNIGLSEMMQDGFSFDRRAHGFLEKHFSSERFDAIFIPYTLSNQNYLELSGIRLALHIRLTPEFGHMRAPIIFIGHESKEQIAKLSEFPSFLFTSGVFSTDKFEYESYLKIYDWLKNIWKPDGDKVELSSEEYQLFLSRINVYPPSNYRSHHSIDNELALLRWSEYLQCDNRIPIIKNNLNTGLYFKYHRALNPVNTPGTGAFYHISGRGKVLLIDDEAEKGWADFYECFFRNSPEIKFDQNSYLKMNFKSLDHNTVISTAVQWIKDNDPDVVLLDLRLCDTDFESNPQPEPQNLTGYTILNEIKKINKGIQVLITTASNKIWNYQSTHDLGANGYIIKRGDFDVAEDIKSLKQSVATCVERADYLKPACIITNTMIKALDLSIKDKKLDKSFGKELKAILELAFEMYVDARKKEDFAYAYLALFKSIELIVDEFTFYDSEEWKIVGSIRLEQYVWDDWKNTYDSNPNTNFRNGIPTTFEKIAGLAFQLWEFTQAAVQQLYYSIRRRNEFIHPSENFLKPNLKSECDKIYVPSGYFVLLKQISELVNNFAR